MNNKLKRSILLLSLTGCFFFQTLAQSQDPFIQMHVDALSYDSVYHRMQTFENFGTKSAGTDALDETRDWIISLYEKWGYTNIEIDSFSYSGHPVQNIIVTKTGTLYPDTYLIVDGHYDTYGGPGVNDNGSGTATVLETARMMKDMETEISIKFIHFTIEELGLVGSTHYVENTVVPENMDVLLVFNIDEVGGVAGEVNNTITCERDEWAPNGNNAASAAYTDTLANLTEMYSSLNTFISYAYGSDYVPFMNNGYVVTGFYEYNESPYPHGSDDLLENLDPDYVFEVARAALASSMYFSGAHELMSGLPSAENGLFDFSLQPNPFFNHLLITNPGEIEATLQIRNLQGQVMFSKFLSSSEYSRVDLDLPAGIYFYEILGNQRLLQSGKLVRH